MTHPTSSHASLQGSTATLRIVRQLLSKPLSALALLCCLLVILAALFAPWLAPLNPYDLASIDIMDAQLAPGSQNFAATLTYYLGTDGQGRDMFSAILYGLRTSLFVGVFSGLIAMTIGTFLGLIAAYYGGRTDTLIMRAVDIMLGFPTIMVALLLLAMLGQGVEKVIFALVVVQWAYYTRAVRSSALVESNQEYMEAARCLALPSQRILLRHLLPNCLSPLIVIGTIQTASAISTEATLSFLGLGVPITEPSLGLLIANGSQFLLSGSYWISLYPGLVLLLTLFSINILGDRLRDLLNPRLQK
ncbi:ABC transporter permease [Balneatrix alpica]|uniref:ABC transporter permease n=1 Tax=Balneatrix alpica TaxID=75684 RepID=UPI00273A066C|nr:ABC transporter permease [Balneatrix alpica]